MPGVVRISDLNSGHDGFPRVSSSSGSLNTISNNLQIVRYGDCRGIHSCNGGCHCGINVGLHNVIVNNRSIQTGSDPTTCGAIQDQCSSNVFVN